MATNFNWNAIPGLHETPIENNNTAYQQTDHFDDFFNNQIQQQPGEEKPRHRSQPEMMYTVNSVNEPIDQGKDQSAQLSQSLYRSMGNLHLNNQMHSSSADNVSLISKNNKQSYDTMIHSSSVNDINNNADALMSLSLATSEMTSTEVRTYTRWFENIQIKKADSLVVTLGDVFMFLQNFKIPTTVQQKIKESFSKAGTALNIGQFFAIMRLLSHTLEGKPLQKSLIKIPAPIPQPLSILSRKRKEAEIEEVVVEKPGEPKKKLDIDSFTEFILTGERPVQTKFKKNTNKKVKFSDVVHFSSPDEDNLHKPSNLPNRSLLGNTVNSTLGQLPLDLSLPMNQLIDRIKDVGSIPKKVINALPNPLAATPQQNFDKMISNVSPVENEEEVLKDVHLDTFKNVTQKASRNNTGDEFQPLEANLTGSASKSMKEHFMNQFEQTFNFNNETNSFNNVYPNISTLAAAASPSPPITQQQNNPSFLQAQNPSVQFQDPSLQNTNQLSPNKQFSPSYTPIANTNDYTNNGLQSNGAQGKNNMTGGIGQFQQLPQPPPIGRIGSSSMTPPPVPPPPPRSRKAQQSTTTYTTVPPPTQGQNPSLPPKPTLNDKQRKQYLSINDEVNRDQQGRSISPSTVVYNTQNVGQVTQHSTGMNSNIPNNLPQSNNVNYGMMTQSSSSRLPQQQQMPQQYTVPVQYGYGQYTSPMVPNHQNNGQMYNNGHDSSQYQQQQQQPHQSQQQLPQFQRGSSMVYNQYNNQQMFMPQSTGQQPQQTGGNRWVSPPPGNVQQGNTQPSWSGWNV